MRRVFLPLALIILLCAAFLRLHQIDLYPPGPHYDEAANLVITRSIAFGGAWHFPIVENFQGREVLYYYLNAPLLHVIGDEVFTMQLSSVFLNLVTIAGTMALGRLMFRGDRGAVIGLVAGILLALSFPQILLSRQAFRAVTLPFLQVLAVLFLWQGMRANKRDWIFLVVGGVFGGLVLYTYNSSRLFPVWMAVLSLAVLFFDRQQWRLRLRQILIFDVVLALVSVPMLIFALNNPDVFLGRLNEVTQTESAISLGESILLHLRMFFLEGDPYFRYNIPQRPYFTLIEGLVLLLGIAVALFGILRGKRPLERAGLSLLILSPLMIVPSVIAVGGLPPSHMRSIAMVPFIFLLIGVGTEWLIRRIPSVRVISAGLLAVLIVGAVLVWNEYVTWASEPLLYTETDADLAQAAEWLQEQEIANQTIYVRASEALHQTMLIEDVPPLRWLGDDTLFLPPEGEQALVMYSRGAPPDPVWADWLAGHEIPDLPLAPDGEPAFTAYRIDRENAQLSSLDAPPENIQNAGLRLLGTKIEATESGGTAQIVTAWEVTQTLPYWQLSPTILLENQLGLSIARKEAPLWFTDWWKAGEVLLHVTELDIPVGTIPGVYDVKMTWANRVDAEVLPFLDEIGAQLSVEASIGTIEITRNDESVDADELNIQNRYDVKSGENVQLLGWDTIRTEIRPGEMLAVTLYWQALETEGEREALPLQAILKNGDSEVVVWEGQAGGQNFPADRWRDGEVVRRRILWEIPMDLEGGTYELELQAGDELMSLGEIEVADVPRVMTAPTAETLLELALGEEIQLYGYTLDREDNRINLELVWKAMAMPDKDYTVFVHLTDLQGNILQQRDAMPNNWRSPTSLWIAGEYVPDIYTFDSVPPGAYRLRIGMYLQDTGERLIFTETGYDELNVEVHDNQ